MFKLIHEARRFKSNSTQKRGKLLYVQGNELIIK